MCDARGANPHQNLIDCANSPGSGISPISSGIFGEGLFHRTGLCEKLV